MVIELDPLTHVVTVEIGKIKFVLSQERNEKNSCQRFVFSCHMMYEDIVDEHDTYRHHKYRTFWQSKVEMMRRNQIVPRHFLRTFPPNLLICMGIPALYFFYFYFSHNLDEEMYAISTIVVVVVLLQAWTKGEKDGPDRKYGGLCKLYDPTNKKVNNVDFDCQTALFSKHDYGLEGILYMILNHDLCSISNLGPVISAIEAMHAKVIISRRNGTVVDVIVPAVANNATKDEEDDVLPVVNDVDDDDSCNEDVNDTYDDYGNYRSFLTSFNTPPS